MSETPSPLDDDIAARVAAITCPGCRAIDAADGKIDGNLFSVPHLHTRDENIILSTIRKAQDQLADGITNFAGSMRFLYLHGAWFALWIALNIGLAGASMAFDKYPFGLLTMIVSLEAIFLSTFVMISQNRQASRSDIRAELDFETNLRSEIWSAHIGAALGIDAEHVEGIVQQALVAARANTAHAQATA